MKLYPNAYPVIRPQIRVGDVFAFSGRGFISGGIRTFAGDPTHVAGVERTDKDEVWLIESTTLSGVKGVQRTKARQRAAEYDGKVILLRRSDEYRAHVNWDRWLEFLKSYEARKVPYDERQCLRMILAPLAHIPGFGILRNHMDLSKVYCSELLAGAEIASGGLPMDFNASDCSPRDYCRQGMWSEAIPIKGDFKINEFNSKPIEWVMGAAA